LSDRKRRWNEWTKAPRTPLASIDRTNRRRSFNGGLGRNFINLDLETMSADIALVFLERAFGTS
jgi:hypothetical protein